MATAIITGASTGIGRDLAKECARAGYDLVVIARTQTGLDSLASEVRAESGRAVRTLTADLARAEAPAEVYAALAGAGDVEVLINNAGVGMLGFFHELDASGQMRMLRLNVDALTELTRLFLPGMVARKRGRVLNVASTAAFQPGPLMAVYYASKAYVLSLSEALHNEMRGMGVTVTTLCPGPTRTEFERNAGMDGTGLFKGPNIMTAEAVARIGFAAMMAGRPLVVPGMLNATLAFLTRFGPRQMMASIARRLQES